MIKILFVLSGIIAALFLYLGSYAVNPLALSPLGTLLFLIDISFWLFLLFRSRRCKLQVGSILLVLLVAGNAKAQGVSSESYRWDPVADNLRGMGDTLLWPSSFELLPNQGVAGYAPLLYRPFVPGHEVGLLVSGAIGQPMVPVGVASGPLLWPGNMSLHALRMIPQHQLPITKIASAPMDVSDIDVCLIFACGTTTDIRINETFLNKFVMTATVEYFLLRHPIKGISHGDFGKVLDMVAPTDWAISSRYVGFGTGRIAGSQLTWAGQYDTVVGGNLFSGNYTIHANTREYTVQTFSQPFIDNSRLLHQQLHEAPGWVRETIRELQGPIVDIRIVPDRGYTMDSFKDFDDIPTFDSLNNLNQLPQMPDVPIWQAMPEITVLHQIPEIQSIQDVPDFSMIWPMPDFHNIPNINIPDFSNIPDHTSVPDFSVPTIPDIPDFTNVPDFQQPVIPDFTPPDIPDFNTP